MDAEVADRPLEATHRLGRERHQCRIQQRRVLALEQADAADPMRAGHDDARGLLADDRGRLFLVGCGQRGEHRRDRDRLQPARPDCARRRGDSERSSGMNGRPS